MDATTTDAGELAKARVRRDAIDLLDAWLRHNDDASMIAQQAIAPGIVLVLLKRGPKNEWFGKGPDFGLAVFAAFRSQLASGARISLPAGFDFTPFAEAIMLAEVEGL